MPRANNPRGNTTPRRYTGGRPPKQVTVEIGPPAMRTLRTLARLANVAPEALAAGLLAAAIEAEWQRYDAQVEAWVDEGGEE